MLCFKQALLCAFMLVSPRLAGAEVFSFSFDFSASGRLGSTQFSNAQVRLVGIGNSDNREPFDLGGGYWVFHDGATVEIEGLGTYTFLSPTRTYVYNNHGYIGFSAVDGDIFDLFAGAQLNTGSFNLGYNWACQTEIGPIANRGNCAAWKTSTVQTSGGNLTIQANHMPVTFEADLIPTPISGSAYCFGDGTEANCPCFAWGGAGEGCANSTGQGVKLIGAGNTILSADTFQLDVTGLPNSTACLVLRGDQTIAVPAGAGILCTTGGAMRSQVQQSLGAVSTFSDFNGSSFGASSNGWGVPTHYQCWYRDTANSCPGTSFNMSNGWVVNYLP